MKWIYYLIACWPLIGLVVVVALCRLINKAKVKSGEVFEA